MAWVGRGTKAFALLVGIVFLLTPLDGDAAQVSLSPTAEGFATDSNGDFVFDFLGTGTLLSTQQPVMRNIPVSWFNNAQFIANGGGYSRPFMEFDLTPIPANATILSANLYFAFSSCSTCYDPFEVHGYVGDGTASLGDVIPTNELLSKVVYGFVMRRRDPGVLHSRI